MTPTIELLAEVKWLTARVAELEKLRDAFYEQSVRDAEHIAELEKDMQTMCESIRANENDLADETYTTVKHNERVSKVQAILKKYRLEESKP